MRDLQEICRTCSLPGGMKPIFSEHDSESAINIAEMLLAVATVSVVEGDNLPQYICEKCTTDLHTAFSFKQQCETVDAEFRKRILQNDRKVTLQDVSETDYENSSDSYSSPISLSELPTQNDISCIDKTEISTSRKCCTICHKNFPTSRFKGHMQTHSKPFICQMCGKQFGSNYNLMRHMKRHTGEKPFKCDVCNKRFIQSHNLKEHRKIHIADNDLEKLIEECTTLTEPKSGSPVPKPKPNRKFCTICQKSFAVSSFQIHIRTHTKEKPYVCQFCGQQFGSNSNLKRHTKRHTGERPYTCHICHKGFIQSPALADHLRVHTGEKPYTCNKCPKSFTTAGNLRAHLKQHLDPLDNESKEDPETKHACNVCQRTFSSKRVLNKHLRTHGDKTFLCSVCGKGFTNKEGLQSHIRSHTGEKPFACSVCSKSFSYSSSLNTHERIHSGVRPHVCNLCNKTFGHHTHLKNHMKTHSGEKPYECNICKKRFMFKGNLTVHLRLHSGEKPYVCQTCGKGFYDSSSRKKHQRTNHLNPINVT